ncbi:adenosine receptor A2a-like [Mytilus trossulus]|uniref:adenosine receptor A2a-like n=1 Tax=Mytilus trossulus TaxID=6551 RepID=UPI00300535D5
MVKTLPYMYISFIILGTTSCAANATLIWIILRNRNFRTISNVIIVSLATSDFLLGFIVSPMEMMHHLLPDFDVIGYGCLAHQVVMIFVPLVSIVHLLLVAIERFVKIVYPLHYHSIATRSRAVILIGLTWLFPFTVSLLPFMGIHQNMESTNTTDSTCATLDMLPCPYLNTVLGMIGVICVFMVILYSVIMKIAYRHAKELRKIRIPKQKGKIFKSSELKALIVLVMTVMYFVLSWAPFSVSVIDECISGQIASYYTPAIFIAYFNSTVNPLIYGIGNRDLRNSFIAICSKQKRNEIAPFITATTAVSMTERKTAETNM